MVKKAQWEKTKLSNVCSIVAPMVNPQESQYAMLPHIGNESIDKHSGLLLNYNLVEDDNLISSKYYFTEKDVLYGKINPQFSKVAYPKFKGLCSADMYPLTCNSRIIPEYLKAILLSTSFWKYTVSLSQRSGMPKVNRQEISNYEFILPEVEEQKNIVVALSDMDALITELRKLIQKKKDIRQGTMQMLVTGKKRLSGFRGDWIKINLSKNSKLKARIGWQGLTTAEYLDEGYSYLITGTDFKDGQINWNGCHYVDYDRYAQDPNIQVSNGDLLLTKDGTIGKVAYVTGLKRPATLNSGVFLVKPITDAYTAHFMVYVLESSVFKDFLQQLSAGSTINHLYQKDLVKFELFVPPTKEEQETIAGILFDMDSEIHKLEEKLSKIQKVKQGMMEELLTGKVRLV